MMEVSSRFRIMEVSSRFRLAIDFQQCGFSPLSHFAEWHDNKGLKHSCLSDDSEYNVLLGLHPLGGQQ
jgi:hypothetical protein